MISAWKFPQFFVITRANYRPQHFDLWRHNSYWRPTIEKVTFDNFGAPYRPSIWFVSKIKIKAIDIKALSLYFQKNKKCCCKPNYGNPGNNSYIFSKALMVRYHFTRFYVSSITLCRDKSRTQNDPVPIPEHTRTIKNPVLIGLKNRRWLRQQCYFHKFLSCKLFMQNVHKRWINK